MIQDQDPQNHLNKLYKQVLLSTVPGPPLVIV